MPADADCPIAGLDARLPNRAVFGAEEARGWSTIVASFTDCVV